MSPAVESLVKKLVIFGTVVGLGSALAFLLVACRSATATRSRPRPAAWEALPKAPIAGPGLAGLTSVWTGKQLVVTAVRPGPDGSFIGSKNLAAVYDPSTRTWSPIEPLPKMDNYCTQDAVWTGKQVLFWGCSQAAYDPSAGSWRMLPKAPTGQGFATWTGHELIGWGGGCCGDAWSDGSAYDPAANRWRTLSRSPLAPASRPLAAWTGRNLIVVVSGFNPEDRPYPTSFARAAAYSPRSDSWSRLAPPPAGTLRYGGVAAWTGRELLVISNTNGGARARAANVALAYDPVPNRWRRLAPPPHVLIPTGAYWTGTRLLLLGGAETERLMAYDPDANRWTGLPRVPVRPSMQGPQETATWTGTSLIVLGNPGAASFSPGD
jgi:hypothetical protein